MHRYREMFRVAGDYCFNQLGVQRVTARTRADKQKVINVMVAAGFRVEGRARRYYPRMVLTQYFSECWRKMLVLKYL